MIGRRAGAVVALAAVLLLTGCGTAPWDQPQFSKGTPRAERSHTASARPTAAPSITAVPNDLASGRAQHVFQAGDLKLTVTYWSTLALSSWKPQADKPISLSLTATSTANPALDVFLSSATVDVTVNRRGGKTGHLPQQVDRATTNPGYEIHSPYSYGESYILPAVDADATSLTLLFTYSLLEQTTPQSSDYTKQSGVDTIIVPLAAAG